MQGILRKIRFFRVPEKGRFSAKYALRAVLASRMAMLYLRCGERKKMLPFGAGDGMQAYEARSLASRNRPGMVILPLLFLMSSSNAQMGCPISP